MYKNTWAKKFLWSVEIYLKQEVIYARTNWKEIKIENMIYEIRGCQVMLDSDLAKLFGYTTKELNRNVKNNKNRFPENYCFQLTDDEYQNLRCFFFTSSSKNSYGGRRYIPYVFTEYGITMLAGVLKSSFAVEINVSAIP